MPRSFIYRMNNSQINRRNYFGFGGSSHGPRTGSMARHVLDLDSKPFTPLDAETETWGWKQSKDF
jgi:hypothetical protein